mmetsp:Transcript_143428/g.357379  ORF Transcript_143428/g.357379 Transcript_143428/m.357379 type:complete len:217 (-) Transcript_143428:330-980(-)
MDQFALQCTFSSLRLGLYMLYKPQELPPCARATNSVHGRQNLNIPRSITARVAVLRGTRASSHGTGDASATSLYKPSLRQAPSSSSRRRARTCACQARHHTIKLETAPLELPVGPLVARACKDAKTERPSLDAPRVLEASKSCCWINANSGSTQDCTKSCATTRPCREAANEANRPGCPMIARPMRARSSPLQWASALLRTAQPPLWSDPSLQMHS